MRILICVGVLCVAHAVAQLNAEAPLTYTDKNNIEYITDNFLIDGFPQQFYLDFTYGKESTLASGIPMNETHINATLTSPRQQWNGLFRIDEVPTLSFSQLAGKGVTVAWCDGIIYTEDVLPATCLSTSSVHARCTKENGCRYPATKDNDENKAIMARADPHAPQEGVEGSCALQLTLANKKRVCATKEGVFNPAENGASIHQTQSFQSLYFDKRTDNGPTGAMFAIIIILCLVVWVQNMPVFVEGADTKTTVTIAWAVADLAITIASASIFAVAEAGIAYTPPELETIIPNSATAWFAVYLVATMMASALASAAAFKRSTELDSDKGKMLAVLVRATLECQLMASLHCHLPKTMGLAMRRTIGFFVGVASLVIVGRDVPKVLFALKRKAAATLALWTVVEVVHVTMAMLFPVIAQSAGIADKASIQFAVAMAVATMTFAVVRMA